MKSSLLIIYLIGVLSIGGLAQSTVKEARTNLIDASEKYRESLDTLLKIHKQERVRIEESVEKSRSLVQAGIISRREYDAVEQKLSDINYKVSDVEKQIASVDNLIAEVEAAEKFDANTRAGARGLMIRYVGSSKWSMTDIDKVEAFFRLRFAKPLPVSAMGQSETHNRLGYDHHNAVDVALHPDGDEGRALINYLQSQNISFIAIKGAISGSSTGAHIHIGQPSKKSVAKK